MKYDSSFLEQVSRLLKECGDFFLREFTQLLKISFYSLERCLSMLLFGIDFNF